MIKVIIFDSDGTLINTTKLITEGFKQVLSDYGYDELATDEIVLANIGKHIPDVFAQITNLAISSKAISDMTDSLDISQDKLAPTSITAYHKEIETLLALKSAGYRIGLFTSGTIYQVKRNYTVIGIDVSVMFDEIVSYEDGAPSKPSPDGLLLCANKLGVRIDQVVYVGDQDVDVKAAINAGAGLSVGISHGFHTVEYLSEQGADYVIDSLEELLKIKEITT
ncbi:MAG: HAD-IA family hydrolase [Candidatus Saccharimonadales bacterium]